MPVFWFSVSFVTHVNWLNTFVAFILIHLLLYPASNGYNSYMDRDTESIGGIKNPMQPTAQLFYATVVMDIAGILFSLIISWQFATSYALYVICSRLYSYRGIRLKRFPVAGYILVILNQGALIFTMVYAAANTDDGAGMPLGGLIASSFLIGGFYPITQIYQHRSDAEDGVKTISMLLGKKGTFVFCICMYAMAFLLLFLHYAKTGNTIYFFLLQVFFIPVIVYFIKWMTDVWKDESLADFKHTMRMNVLAGTCTNLAFITIILLQNFV